MSFKRLTAHGPCIWAVDIVNHSMCTDFLFVLTDRRFGISSVFCWIPVRYRTIVSECVSKAVFLFSNIKTIGISCVETEQPRQFHAFYMKHFVSQMFSPSFCEFSRVAISTRKLVIAVWSKYKIMANCDRFPFKIEFPLINSLPGSTCHVASSV